MLAALALAVLASTAPTQGYDSSIKSNQVTVRFYDLTKVYGPFKFYVSASAIPAAAACATCPPGVTASHVVMPGSVVQKWAPNGRYVEATFPLSSVSNMGYFYFTAVTCVPNAERFLASGAVALNRAF